MHLMVVIVLTMALSIVLTNILVVRSNARLRRAIELFLLESLLSKPVPSSLTVLFNGQSTQGEQMNLSVDKPVQITIAEADQFGNAEAGVQSDAPLAFSVSDPSLGVITPGADGLSASFQPSGKIGDLVISVSGSFAGVPLNGSGSGTLVAGAITQLTLNLVQ